MSPISLVVNSFTVDFFETLAKNPADMAEKFSSVSSLILNDFECGLAASEGSAVPENFQKWATSLDGSKIRVDGVNGVAVQGGVSAFIQFHAVGKFEQFYQMSVNLEAVDTYNGEEAYFIRELTISRVGAAEVEVVPPPPPPPAPVKKAPAPAKERTPAKERPVEATPVKEEAKKPEQPAAAPATAAAALKEESGAPFSWKTRVASPVAAEEAGKSCVRVVVAAKPAVATANAKEARKDSPKVADREREHPKREKKPMEPLGDRLMFSIDAAVQDQDIRTGLGALHASLVSLRNNSNNGHVFMDFAEGVKAYDELRKNPLIVASKKVSVFRQRSRDGKE